MLEVIQAVMLPTTALFVQPSGLTIDPLTIDPSSGLSVPAVQTTYAQLCFRAASPRNPSGFDIIEDGTIIVIQY